MRKWMMALSLLAVLSGGIAAADVATGTEELGVWSTRQPPVLLASIAAKRRRARVVRKEARSYRKLARAKRRDARATQMQTRSLLQRKKALHHGLLTPTSAG